MTTPRSAYERGNRLEDDDERPSLLLTLMLAGSIVLCAAGAVYAVMSGHPWYILVAFVAFAVVIALGMILVPPPVA